MRKRLMQVLVPLLPLAALAPADAGDIVRVTIDDLTYAPAVVSVKVGDTVAFDNRDFIDHTATAETGNFDVTLPAQASAQTVMREEGTFRYICRYHPNMTAEIRVTGR